MDPKNKTLVPLIIVFFILGAVVGYVAHKPETITKTEYVNRTVEVIVTVTPSPTPAPEITPVLTPVPTVYISPEDYTIIKYEQDISKADRYVYIEDNPWHLSNDVNVIEAIRNNYDVRFSIKQGQRVLFRITEYSPVPTLFTISSEKQSNDVVTSGGRIIYVQFNNKGEYTFSSYLQSSTPDVSPALYTKGTITVY